MTGTWINAAAVAVGALLGLWLGGRLADRYSRAVLTAMGLVTLILGISMAGKVDQMIVVVLSLVVGTLVGEALCIDRGLDRMAQRLRRLGSKKEGGGGKFVEGFVTTSLLFCVGSMSILGPIEEATGGGMDILLTKSVMDGVCAFCFAASLGVGVLFSALVVVLYQGAVALGAGSLVDYLSPEALANMTATGGVLLVGLGISILEIKPIKVVNMLPALIFSVLLTLWG